MEIPTITIDTDAPCPRCGKPGLVNGGMCLDCENNLLDEATKYSKAQYELFSQRRAIFERSDVPKCPTCKVRPSVNHRECLSCVAVKLNSRKAVSLKHLPDRWPAEPAVVDLAQQLIDKHHQEAEVASIAIIFKREHSETNGKVKLGTCAKQSATSKMLHGWDYIIELAWDMWAMMDFRMQEACLLHEILHIDQSADGDGNVVWKIEPHSVEEHVKVIEVYGLWKPDLEAFAAAIQKAQEAEAGHQMSFGEFFERNAEPEDLEAEVN